MIDLTSRTLAARLARSAALCLAIAGLQACDDGEDNGSTDTGGAGGSGDMLPVTDGGRDAMRDMMPVEDQGPGADMAPPDLGPDMGQCTEDDQCAVDSICAVGRCVEGQCVVEPVPGCCAEDADCGEGGRCLVELNVCAEAGQPGALVITELMIDPDERADDAGEWLELYNTTDAPISLNGWALTGGDGEAHTITGAAPIAIAPGAWFVMARAADAVAPVAVDYVYDGLDLVNGGDTVALLDAFGATIDSVTYGEGWPLEAGRSLSLSGDQIDADANDTPEAWCAADPNWGGTDRGTPGAENPACPGGPEPIDWCRLQWPLDVESTAGADVTFYGRVFEAGVTDRTDGTDADPRLLAQVGYGPDASDPAGNAEWVWTDAPPNAGWSGEAEGEPGNDEYMVALTTPAPGVYDHAFRFSADAGETWTYCDRRTDAGDGAEDGYQIEAAGSLTSVPGPCDPNPCDAAPEAGCDGNIAVTYAAEGVCAVDGEGFTCDYAIESQTDCADDGQVCTDGACVAPEPLAGPGQLVITEILYDPHDAIPEPAGEWFEVFNTTDQALRLDGCTLVDSSPDNAEIIERLVIPGGGYAVFAGSADPAVNGGLPAVAHVFGFSLNNGGDTISITCGDDLVDAVVFTDAEPFPINARRTSIALDPGSTDAEANGDGANWCFAEDIYYDDADDPAFDHRGTPGAANPPCPVPDVDVDWCRLQFPLDVEAGAATQLSVFGRVFEAGITDRSEATDPDGGLMAQVGYGADGSDPAAADAMWTWFEAAPNAAWIDADEPGNDEYMATFAVPVPGAYDFAYRFSRDAGATWLYCDRSAGEGADGAEDGYLADNAGQLTSLPSPCEVEQCDAPPAPTCADDGVTRVTYTGPGACEVVEAAAACTYIEATEDCGATGGTCEAGACVGGAPLALPGEVLITEFMADPHGVLADGDAEWIELTNVSDHAVTLNGCTLVDNFADNAELLGPVVIEAGGIALFAKTDDALLNGGLPAPTALFGFGLNNGGDQINLICAEQTIDSVDYSADGFPDVDQRVALQRTGDTWCPAGDVYFGEGEDTHRGTPGAANPPCPSVTFCSLQWPPEIAGVAGLETVVYGRVVVPGITDTTAGTDVDPRVWGQLGWGPDASDPTANAAWTWQRADANPGYDDAMNPGQDEYQSTLVNPAVPGVYDYAYRFSADSGRTWTYCDLDNDANGYSADQAGALTVQADGDPCDPNPCDAPPATECDNNTVVSYVGVGACENQNGAPACSYDVAERVDCLDGEACVAGACIPEGARAPAVGEVIFTEVMYDPHSPLLDDNAEWIEIHNTTDEPLNLDGCRLSVNASGIDLGQILMAPGAYAFFVKSEDAALNGGLEGWAGSFGFAVGNGGATMTLDCGGDAPVDVVVYDDAAPWPADAQRHSINLDPAAHDAVANNEGANWCYSRTRYYDGDPTSTDHFGTPGAANVACDEPVDFCRLQWPPQINELAGTEVPVYARLYEEGVTDRSPMTDRRQDVIAQLGWGPDGTLPGMDQAWQWVPGAPNDEWNGADNGVENEDEYYATLMVPDAGPLDYAWRFSADGGRTWTFCDGGDAGSSDGYQPDNAGDLQVAAIVSCDPNPCLDVPADTCADDVTRNVYPAEGACALVEGVAECTYTPEAVPCPDGETCLDGACRPAGARAPAVGEVVITELLYDPHGAVLTENDAEWIEIHNATDEPLALDGCSIGKGDQRDVLDGLILPAGAWAVLTKGAADVNGGIEPFGAFTFALTNGGATVDLTCGDDPVAGLIDAVTYDDAAPWPRDAQRHSISLDAGALTAAANDDGANWCYGRPIYWQNDADAADDHRGTPGVANPPCDEAVDFCRLQSPLEVLGVEGELVPVYGRLYEEGTTDRTSGTDARQHVMLQFGWGADGVDPADWVWSGAQPNVAWDGAAMGVDSEDEYQYDWLLPGGGLYGYGFRASVDGGRTWTLCDGDAEGNTDGFDEPGVALVDAPANACEPNPCDAPPAADCADDVTRRTYADVGDCALDGDAPVCTYAENLEPCGDGFACDAGACVEVGGPAAPLAGEVIFTELMYDPHGPLSDNDAEWFELHNTTDAPLSLAQCTVTANGNGGPIGDVVIPANGWALFAKSADPALNGGLVPDGTFTLALGNGGAALALTCAGAAVDDVTYDDAGEWPHDAQAHSISLDANTLTAADNDTAGNWCYGRPIYFRADTPAGDNRGTPGMANPPCDEAVDFCRLQSPIEIEGTSGDVVTVYGRIYEEGTTDRHPGVDARQHIWAEFGWGVDGADAADWTWLGAAPNDGWDGVAAGFENEDEYQFDWTLPAEGLYSFGYRFTADGGRTWTLCDGDAEGNTDGFDEPGVALAIAPIDPCDGVVCESAPPTACADNTTRRVFQSPGQCEINAQLVGECVYLSDDVPCAPGEVCVNGACLADGPRAPGDGEVIFTEIMYDPHGSLAEGAAEWFELHNTTDVPLDLEGCTVASASGETLVGALVIEPRGWALFAQTDDAAANGGLVPDALFDFALGNSGGPVTLTCVDVVDTVTYDDNTGAWPRDARRNSISLDPGALDALANNVDANWCFGRDIYFDSPVGVLDDHNGTPGAANPPCDDPIDFCRLQHPTEIDGVVGATERIYARLYDQGITDRWGGVDNFQFVEVEFGRGLDGTDPIDWVWDRAVADLDWRGVAAGVPDEDQYYFDWALPAEGLYAYGFRASVDGGRTWTLCDGDAEGNTDGFDEPGVALTAGPASCEPNPCLQPPVADCADATTTRTYAAEGVCAVVANATECTYEPILTACGAAETCVDGACAGPRAPAAGDVIFTEVMYDPHGVLADGRAEWLELHNTTGEPLDIEGCTVTANGGGGALPAAILEPGAYFLIGQSADLAENGGLTFDAILPFAAGNGGSTLLLNCDNDGDPATFVDRVVYDDNDGVWPQDAQRHSISLDAGATDAAANDVGTNWCYGRALYFADDAIVDDHRGTPGEANPPCDEPVDFCRLQAPTQIDGAPGDVVPVFGRLYEAGTTDRSPGNDARQYVWAEFGFGGDDPAGWTWLRADANAAWDGAANAVPDEDEYMIDWTLPAEGIYAYGFRFSVDGGRTWTLCDGDAEGNTDGFDEPGVALTAVAANVCEPNPCVDVPADACVDGTTARIFAGPGVCAVGNAGAECTYDSVDVPCDAGDVCDAGACVPAPLAEPTVGQVVINEVMYDPHGALTDGTAEWLELRNTTDAELNLAGCALTANGNGDVFADGVTIAAQGFLVVGQSADQASNGGLQPDVVMNIAFGNGGSTLLLACPATPTVDTVSYDDAAPWPRDARRQSISADPAADAAGNDVGDTWCYARDTYYLDADPAEDHLGTPGAANPVCDEPVDFCRLQSPTEIDGTEGDQVVVFGRIFEAGTTDRHPGVDARQHILAQFGWGADGVDAADWTWTNAAPNPAWDGAAVGVPDEDEYQATWALPAEGIYNFGYRFSADGGRTWTLCDGDAEGNTDGFDAPGLALTVGADPCTLVACDQPPVDECGDETTLVVYNNLGVCSLDAAGAATCDYDFNFVPCDAGEICSAGVCALPPAPLPIEGEIAFTEVMYDPTLDDAVAEWIEIHNLTNVELGLDGCTISDASNINPADLTGQRIPAGGYLVVAASDDPAANGGLEAVAATFGFTLNNGGDTVTLTCPGDVGDVAIDVLTYDDNFQGWPNANGGSTQLDAMRNDELNTDDGQLWCLSSATYGTADHLGTPGAPNHNCEVDFCRLQWNPDVRTTWGSEVGYYAQFYRFGVTDQADPAPADWMVEMGFGPDGEAFDTANWQWIDAAPNADWDFAGNDNDEWQAAFVAPERIGQFDTAFRISTDGGQRWIYCDADDAGNTNGLDAPGNLILAAPAFTAQALQARFNVDCNGCHVGGGQSGGLTLDAFEATTINVLANGPAQPMALITPGVPEASYLFLKISNTHALAGGGGGQMPPGNPWSVEDMSRLAAYIQGLAP